VRGSNRLVGVGTEVATENHWAMSNGSALPNIPTYLKNGENADMMKWAWRKVTAMA
jgi:hypothetical protein